MSALNYIGETIAECVNTAELVTLRGRVTKVLGTILHAQLPGVETGELCLLTTPGQERDLMAEVIGFDKHDALLTPLGDMQGISGATEVIPTGKQHTIAVGDNLLGRVLDGMGQPIDTATKGPLICNEQYPVYAPPPDPLTRRLIDKPLSLGVKAIDGFITCGEGQRLGVFAAAGGGKTTLLSMLVKGADVDVVVIALIGERGREVREFLEHDLGPEGVKKAVIVVATSDRPSMERAKAAYVSTAIAEYFRDQGKRVLLLMDSVTRFARAQREIGLAAGEPPTRRGFPPSVFATLPKLMERTGLNDKGSITALYTVLVEGDDMTEPVADETRSILDGHIILSRKLGAANHYPAIDVLGSISRVMNNITNREHIDNAGYIRRLMSKYQDVELLVNIGEYQQGEDPDADEAIAKIGDINEFLQQGCDQIIDYDESLASLANLTL
ncbi:type III secretion system ATPase SctN [Thalassomonas sp. RHCl1]|uniref:type III secretion system ATPase SctN n=1 Tax=Thalassomonas sp. RHCl1 TaxID=2995320 RepID=UPI00248A9785|nr:type III secretion system ATPase SctN [Thalassomonas sp. RHCl1]